MLRHLRIVLPIITAASLSGVMAVNTVAAKSAKSTGVVSPTSEAENPEKEKKLGAATEPAKQLLLVHGYEQERENFDGRMDEIYGGKVRQAAHRP
jgi:hypothetical protein